MPNNPAMPWRKNINVWYKRNPQEAMEAFGKTLTTAIKAEWPRWKVETDTTIPFGGSTVLLVWMRDTEDAYSLAPEDERMPTLVVLKPEPVPALIEALRDELGEYADDDDE